MDCLVVSDLALLHGRAKSALGALWPFILHLLELILTCKLIKVAIRIADLVPVRSVPRNPVGAVLALAIDNILCQALLLQCQVVAISNTHQLLNQLLFGYLFAVNELLQ